jgi:trans-aconitate 2-methyltransferase
VARSADWDPARYEGSHSFVWEYGADLVSLLNPRAGERILDVGCGTGHLAARIAESGSEVLGIDSSPAMIAQARQNFPKLQFQLADVREFRATELFDAVFSNAALHWIQEAEQAAAAMSAALHLGGRLVLEMGAKGNIALISSALETKIQNYFPGIGEYAGVLERHGLEVLNAVIFDRPTGLAGGERGLRDWIATFRPDNSRAIEDVERELRPALFRDGKWFADYRRLRVVARKAR